MNDSILRRSSYNSSKNKRRQHTSNVVMVLSPSSRFYYYYYFYQDYISLQALGQGAARVAHAPPRSQKGPPDGIVKDLKCYKIT